MNKVTFSETNIDSKKDHRTNKKPILAESNTKITREPVKVEQKNSAAVSKNTRSCDKQKVKTEPKPNLLSKVKSESKAVCGRNESPVKADVLNENSNKSAKSNDSKSTCNVSSVKSSVVNKKSEQGNVKRDVEAPKVLPVLPQPTKKKSTEVSKLRSIRRKPGAAPTQPPPPSKAVSGVLFVFFQCMHELRCYFRGADKDCIKLGKLD